MMSAGCRIADNDAQCARRHPPGDKHACMQSCHGSRQSCACKRAARANLRAGLEPDRAVAAKVDQPVALQQLGRQDAERAQQRPARVDDLQLTVAGVVAAGTRMQAGVRFLKAARMHAAACLRHALTAQTCWGRRTGRQCPSRSRQGTPRAGNQAYWSRTGPDTWACQGHTTRWMRARSSSAKQHIHMGGRAAWASALFVGCTTSRRIARRIAITAFCLQLQALLRAAARSRASRRADSRAQASRTLPLAVRPRPVARAAPASTGRLESSDRAMASGRRARTAEAQAGQVAGGATWRVWSGAMPRQRARLIKCFALAVFEPLDESVPSKLTQSAERACFSSCFRVIVPANQSCLNAQRFVLWAVLPAAAEHRCPTARACEVHSWCTSSGVDGGGAL